MAKKCPPGQICIETYTLVLLSFTILIILFFIWHNYSYNSTNKIDKNIFNSVLNTINTISDKNVNNNTPLNQNNNDILMDPYVAPLRNDLPILSHKKIMPINIPTQGVNSEYRQVGILTRINGPETILPLMGRPLIPARDKWNFYTMNDKNNMIKLPITHKNKSCTNEYGCDNIYNGDNVYVEGYNDAFKATMYENNTLRYIPYL